MIDLLYIHPHGHLLRENILPVGAISCINGFKGSKRGIYSSELTADIVCSARVIAIDLYWATALRAVEAVVSFIRDCSPDVPIIIGGLTATRMSGILESMFDVDYILNQVHCEKVFSDIVSFHVSHPEYGRRRLMNPEPSLPMDATCLDAMQCTQTDWFSMDRPVSHKFLHISRACCNPQGPCRRCSLFRSHVPSDCGDHIRLEDLQALLEDHSSEPLEIYAGGLPTDFLATIFDLLSRSRYERPLHVNTCGFLPREVIPFADYCRDNPVGLNHIVAWNMADWNDPVRAEGALDLLAELILATKHNPNVHIFRNR